MNRLDMTEQERSVQHARVHSVHSLMGMREAEAPAFRRRRISLRHHQRGGGYMTVAHLLRNPFSKQTSDICFHPASIVVALFYYVVLPRRPSLQLLYSKHKPAKGAGYTTNFKSNPLNFKFVLLNVSSFWCLTFSVQNDVRMCGVCFYIHLLRGAKVSLCSA